MRRIIALLLCLLMLVGMLAGCGDEGVATEPQAGATEAAETSTEAANPGEAEPVTIRLMSNWADRTSATGLIEETLIQRYMKENPHINIVVEALDDDNYNIKFKAYASTGELPDLMHCWVTPQWMTDVVNANLVEPLDPTDYTDYGFLTAALDCATFNDALYALPLSTDAAGFFYNKDIFEQYGLEVPETWDDMLNVIKVLNDNGVTPCAIPGQAEYLAVFLIHAMIATVKGEDSIDFIRDSIGNKDFSDPIWKEVTAELQEVAPDLFQFGFESTDYGTALNMFKSGQTAMLWMGTWETGMGTDFRLGFFDMPDYNADGVSAFYAYYGTGYMVSKNSAVKDEAIKLMNYLMLPEHWNAMSWEAGTGMSAQDFTAYYTGNEIEAQLEVVSHLTNAIAIAGTPFSEAGGTGCDLFCNEKSINVVSGIITPDEFVEQMKEIP